MGIKDNFSQAVKELWKKDGDQPDNSSRAAKPTELDQYLRQDSQLSDPVNEPHGVPLETPYYRNEPPMAPDQISDAEDTASAQNTAPSSNFAANAQNTPSAPSAQSTQSFRQNQSPSSAASVENQQSNYDNTADSANVNRNVQNIRRNSVQNNQNGYNQNGYNQNGYGAQGSFGQNSYNQGGFGQGGGNDFVPPVQGGAPMQAASETDEVTVISKNTHIDGNVRSLANMQIDGNVKGNIETTKNVDISGKIIGDITCNNAGMNSAAMQGNVSLKGRIRMDRDTILIGDLSSQYADINGRVRGKLDIAGKAELKRDAIVFGDINASTIAVTDGAIIQGYVNTTFLSKEDSRNVFPEAISMDSKDGQAKS